MDGLPTPTHRDEENDPHANSALSGFRTWLADSWLGLLSVVFVVPVLLFEASIALGLAFTDPYTLPMGILLGIFLGMLLSPLSAILSLWLGLVNQHKKPQERRFSLVWTVLWAISVIGGLFLCGFLFLG